MKLAIITLIGALILTGFVVASELNAREGVDYNYIWSHEEQRTAEYKTTVVYFDPVCYAKNSSCSDPIMGKNIVFVKYNYRQVPTKIAGVSIGNKLYYGRVYVDEASGVLSRWRFPIGDRKVGCFSYEIDKGVCEEIRIK